MLHGPLRQPAAATSPFRGGTAGRRRVNRNPTINPKMKFDVLVSTP
jgi:hypothetical protein